MCKRKIKDKYVLNSVKINMYKMCMYKFKIKLIKYVLVVLVNL